MLTHLEQREVFHIAFLRLLAQSLKPNTYAVKGGVNLRLFFGSARYSEDMDIDVKGIEVFRLKDVIMGILTSKTLLITLKPFRIEKILPPSLNAAKQTETTQRFKIHLISSSSEDLFTKIEFSRREFDPSAITETVDITILESYKLKPLVVSHYPAPTAIAQKIRALALRAETQARDVFDLYMLLGRFKESGTSISLIPESVLKRACDNVSKLGFEVFKDHVLHYLKDEDRHVYDNKDVWGDIQLKVGQMIAGLIKQANFRLNV